jgi:hypothetical protein
MESKMKLNKREDIKVAMWINEELATNDSNIVYAEIEENDIFLLIKTESKDYKLKISKYENSKENEPERGNGVQES